MKIKLKQYIPLIIFIVSLIVFALKAFIASNKIDNNAVFVVAKVFKISIGGKTGWYYYYYYNLKGTRHEFSVVGKISGMNDNGLIFVEIDSLDNSHNQYMEFTKVPDCIKISDVPFGGWKKLPKCE